MMGEHQTKFSFIGVGPMNRAISLCALAALTFAVLTSTVRAGEQTALDRYIAAPDASYEYHEVSSQPGALCDNHILEMTSQTWKSEKIVDKPVWKHWLILHIPKNVQQHVGMLVIGGGSNERPAPTSGDKGLDLAAVATHSVVAELTGIPSEPLVFVGETRKRTEDAIIAYTWDQYLRTGDESWPLRLPMTKSAVRAMDTVTSFCRTEAGGKLDINQFVVTGGSKRGWTTWATAAVDKRVVAIVPIVIDTLNMGAYAGRQIGAYGEYSSALKDYTDVDLAKWNGTPEFRKLMEIEDPYTYRDRFTMPKYLINSTGDQYFMPDNSQFYFNDLPGIKYLRYVPNTDHSLRGSDATQSLLAFYGATLEHKALPKFTWKLEGTDAIRVHADDKPTAVKLWQATDPKARDFRLAVIGAKWSSTDLTADASGDYLGKIEKPAPGWTAFMVELTFDNGALPPLKFTTQVRVTPDTMPFADKLKAK
jgi:PhoPQ-activated pathogenicity-related protein